MVDASKQRMRTVRRYMCSMVTWDQVLKVGLRPRSRGRGWLAFWGIGRGEGGRGGVRTFVPPPAADAEVLPVGRLGHLLVLDGGLRNLVVSLHGALAIELLHHAVGRVCARCFPEGSEAASGEVGLLFFLCGERRRCGRC